MRAAWIECTHNSESGGVCGWKLRKLQLQGSFLAGLAATKHHVPSIALMCIDSTEGCLTASGQSQPVSGSVFCQLSLQKGLAARFRNTRRPAQASQISCEGRFGYPSLADVGSRSLLCQASPPTRQPLHTVTFYSVQTCAFANACAPSSKATYFVALMGSRRVSVFMATCRLLFEHFRKTFIQTS